MRRIIIFLCVMIGVISVSGCANSLKDNAAFTEPYIAKVNYNITVPGNEKNKYSVNVDLPLYYLYYGIDYYSQLIDPYKDYVIGEDIELEGKNVDELYGETININQSPLEELFSNDDYNIVLDYIEQSSNYGENNKRLSEKEFARIKSLCKDYIKSGYLLSLNMYISKDINKDVEINDIYISDLKLHYPIDTLKFSLMEIEDNILPVTDSVFEQTSMGGISMGAYISQTGYVSQKGIANTDINKITLISMDDKCTVVTSDNYRKFQESFFVSPGENHLEKIKKRTEFELWTNYVLSETQTNLFSEDGIMKNLCIVCETENNQKYWQPVYIPSIVDGRYLIGRLILERGIQ